MTVFRPHPRLTSRLDRVGQEGSPVIVVDNFLADPQALVDEAAAMAPFAPAQQTFYPGVRAPVPLPFVQAAQAFLDRDLRAVFGLGDQVMTSGAWVYSLVTTPPGELTPRQRLPHIDSTNPANLALLLYLCGEEQGGTSLYRHRATGYESITEDRFDRYEAKLKRDMAAGSAGAAAYVCGDTDHFERITRYGAAFNRLLVYRGNALHSADIAPDFAFDPDPRRGRLTLNLFFHYRPRAPA